VRTRGLGEGLVASQSTLASTRYFIGDRWIRKEWVGSSPGRGRTEARKEDGSPWGELGGLAGICPLPDGGR
jgi:hypothetical protein